MEKKIVIEKALEKKAYKKWRQINSVFKKVFKIVDWIMRVILITTVIMAIYGNHITGEYIEAGFLNVFGGLVFLLTIPFIMSMFINGFGLLENVSEVKRIFPSIAGVALLISLHFTAVFIDYKNYGYISLRNNIWWYQIAPITVLFKVMILMMIISLITKIVCTIIDYRNQDYVFMDFYRFYNGNFDENFFKNLKLKKKFRN